MTKYNKVYKAYILIIDAPETKEKERKKTCIIVVGNTHKDYIL